MPAIAWLTSARDRRVVTAVRAWLAVALPPDDPTVPVVVISRPPPSADDPDNPAHELSRVLVSAGIAAAHVDVASHREAGSPSWREQADDEIVHTLRDHGVDAVLLLGHGWWATSRLYEAFPCVNIHPAVPGGPVGTERAVIDQLLAAGAGTTGLTAHVVGPDHDRGPVVAAITAPMPARRTGWPRRALDRQAVAALHGRLLPDLVVTTMRQMATASAGAPSAEPSDPSTLRDAAR